MKYFAIAVIATSVVLLAAISGAEGQSTCCNVDCQVSAWSDWSPCSVSCGGGTQTRTRTITVPNKDGGAPCPALTDTQSCNTQACPTPYQCTQQPVDVLLLIDRTAVLAVSQTVYNSFWNNVALLLLSDFSQGVNIAVGAYDTSIDSGHTTWLQPASAQSAYIQSITNAGQTRNIGQVLQAAAGLLEQTGVGLRNNSRRVVVLGTLGTSSDDPTPHCMNLKSLGIDVYMVGIETTAPWFNDSNSAKGALLRLLAPLPLETYLTTVTLPYTTNRIDPAVALMTKIRNLPGRGDMCSMMGGSHITTFDGNSYTFPAYGEYTLTAPCSARIANELVAQVRMLPCGCAATSQSTTNIPAAPSSGLTCAKAYAFADGTDTVEVGFHESVDTLFVYLNGILQDRVPNPTLPSGTYVTIYPRVSGGFDVFVGFATGHFIALRFAHTTVGASVLIRLSTASMISSQAVGLCGLYDGCPLNDFYTRDMTNVLSTASASDLYSFGLSYRVMPTESLFVKHYAAEEYFYGGWSPSFPPNPLPADTTYSQAAQQACFPLPDGPVQSLCLYDVSQSSTNAAMAYMDALYWNCDQYCSMGVFPATVFAQSALSTQSLPHVFTTQCDNVCRYGFSELYVPSASDLHTVYNNTSLPPVDLRGADLPNSLFFFHPRMFRGGSYTFMRTTSRPDFCASPLDAPVSTKNVTVNIACLPLPSVTVNNIGPIYSGNYGFPLVTLDATLQFASSSVSAFELNSLIMSWGFVSYVPPVGMPIPSITPTLTFSNSLSARFLPAAPGVYTFEFALSDGCAVSRSTMNVVVATRCCTPDYNIGRVLASTWSSGFPSRSLSLTGSVLTVPQVSPPAGSGAFHPANFPYPLADGYRGLTPTQQLNTSWVLLGHKNHTGAQSPIDAVPFIVSQSSSQIVYNVTIVLTPTQYVNNSNFTAVTASNYSLGPYTVPDHLPASSPLKKIINLEATFFQTLTSTSSNFTQYNLTVIIPQTFRSCAVTLTNPTSVTATASFAPPTGAPAFNTIANQCVGFYTFQSAVNIRGYSAFCSQSRSIDVAVNCAHRPIALISCESQVNFDYQARAFPSVTVIGHGSVDPASNPLAYQWTFASYPASSVGPLLLTGCTASTPDCQFTPDTNGTFVVSMSVSNGCDADTNTVQIVSKCGAPARAVTGPTINFSRNMSLSSPPAIQLNASDSYSPGGLKVLAFAWTVVSSPGGVGASFDNPTSATPNLLVSAPGSYVVELFVSDGCTSDSAMLQVNVACPEAITAVATYTPVSVVWNQTTQSFPQVTLNASSSTITSPFKPSYFWFIISKPALAGFIPNATTVINTFTPTVSGQYVWGLAVNDGCLSATATVTVTAECSFLPPPIVANVLPTHTYAGSIATLSATLSDPHYPSWNILSYAWVITSAPLGSMAVIVDPTAATTNFTADLSGQYKFMVTVMDNCSDIATAQTTLTVDCYPSQAGAAISTTAVMFSNGAFPRVEVNGNPTVSGGQQVSLFSYVWQFTAAPPTSTYAPSSTVVTTVINSTYTNMVQISPTEYIEVITVSQNTTVQNYTNYAQLRPSDGKNFDLFPACFHPDVPGVYMIQLTISDGCRTTTSNVMLNASCNSPPVAVASAVPSASGAYVINSDLNTVIMIDGSASYDVDGSDELTYTWYWNSAPAGQELLADANEPIVQFTPTMAATYSIALVVNDGCQSSAAVVVNVVVTSSCTAVVAESGETVNAAYDYLHDGTSVSFCLDGQADSMGPGGVAGGWSTAKDTTAPLVASARGVVELGGPQSPANTYTQLQCDSLYSWTLIGYSETSSSSAANPCANGAPSWECAAIPVSPSGKVSPSSDDTSVTKKGWFIAIMVLIAVGAALIIGYCAFKRLRRPNNAGPSSPAAGYVSLPRPAPGDENRGTYEPPDSNGTV